MFQEHNTSPNLPPTLNNILTLVSTVNQIIIIPASPRPSPAPPDPPEATSLTSMSLGSARPRPRARSGALNPTAGSMRSNAWSGENPDSPTRRFQSGRRLISLRPVLLEFRAQAPPEGILPVLSYRQGTPTIP